MNVPLSSPAENGWMHNSQLRVLIAYSLSASVTESDVTVRVSDKRPGHDTFLVVQKRVKRSRL